MKGCSILEVDLDHLAIYLRWGINSLHRASPIHSPITYIIFDVRYLPTKQTSFSKNTSCSGSTTNANRRGLIPPILSTTTTTSMITATTATTIVPIVVVASSSTIVTISMHLHSSHWCTWTTLLTVIPAASHTSISRLYQTAGIRLV